LSVGPALLDDQATLDAYLGSGIRRRDERSTFVPTE
jgi:hypothetical protein